MAADTTTPRLLMSLALGAGLALVFHTAATAQPAPEQPLTDTPIPAPAPPPDPRASVDGGTFGTLSARAIGPALPSGRIADIAVNPSNFSEFYLAVASGGVWKTTDAGVTFAPIFDGYGSYSTGCVTLDPSNSSTVWVGSGENNSQRSVGWGDGVYVSRNGGKSFTNVGLKESEHIGSIVVDPNDSNRVFVAAMGPLWRAGGERGVYRTLDGGGTWERVFHVSDETGINEVHMDPRDPNTLYACAYQRRRHQWTLINGGPEGAIYKSVDGGANWRKITSGLPGGDIGRIGMAISPANPDTLYAIVEASGSSSGLFRSRDRGETWEKRSGYICSSPQYYNEIVADPKDVDTIYIPDTVTAVSRDGGATTRSLGNQRRHVDDHAVWINPNDASHMRIGGDGGLYESFSGGRNWRHATNLSVTQFYRVAIDNDLPFYNVYGGTQDNNTVGGPSRTTDGIGIANEHWFIVQGGDGFEPAIDPTDPNIVYGQAQHGEIVRFDRRNGESVDIKPIEPAESPGYVWNWDSPLLISPHNPQRLYFAADRLLRSDDRGDSWREVSGDLTRGIDRNQLKVMGKVQNPEAIAKHKSTSIYGNAIALDESPLVEGLIYVGTDDGLVQVTEDGGQTWRKVEAFPVVPDQTYVSELCASSHVADRVYACFDNHKNGDFTPYVLRSDDRGRTWTNVVGDIPANNVAYTLVEDHVDKDLLFVGTEFGAYYTLDGGTKWIKVAGLPTIPIRDLEIQKRENDLVMASFGRGFYIVDDYSPLRGARDGMHTKAGAIFPVRPALSYLPRSRLGGGGFGTVGETHFGASNPAFGATFTYTNTEKLTTRRERRTEAQGKGETPYPPISDLQAEEREIEPQVLFTIRDAQGAIVRRLPASREKGVHRISWDLRHASISDQPSGAKTWPGAGAGSAAVPGTYSARLSKLVDGVETDLGDATNFEVRALETGAYGSSADARVAKHDFEMKVDELMRAISAASTVLNDATARVDRLRGSILASPLPPGDRLTRLEAIRVRLDAIRTAMNGDDTIDRNFEARAPSIAERAGRVAGSTGSSMGAPTGTQRQQYEIAATQFEGRLSELRTLVETDIGAIEKELEAAGAPWVPGRLPEWKRR